MSSNKLARAVRRPFQTTSGRDSADDDSADDDSADDDEEDDDNDDDDAATTAAAVALRGDKDLSKTH